LAQHVAIVTVLPQHRQSTLRLRPPRSLTRDLGLTSAFLVLPSPSWIPPSTPPFLVRLTDVDPSPTFTDPRRRRPSGGPQDGAPPPSGSPRRGGSNAPTLASWDAPVRPRASASAVVTTFSGTRKASSIFRAPRMLRQRGIHLAARAPPVIHPSNSLSGEKTPPDPDPSVLQRGPCIFCFPNPRSPAMSAASAQSAASQLRPDPPVSPCG
jgi:hypothetical protein